MVLKVAPMSTNAARLSDRQLTSRTYKEVSAASLFPNLSSQRQLIQLGTGLTPRWKIIPKD